MKEELKIHKIPSPVDFILHTPLYEPLNVFNEQVWDVVELMYFNGTYDCFCPSCGKESTFEVMTTARPADLVRNERKERLDKDNGVTPKHPSLKEGMPIGKVPPK